MPKALVFPYWQEKVNSLIHKVLAKSARRLFWPFTLFAILLVPADSVSKIYGDRAMGLSLEILTYGVGIAFFLSLAWLLVRLIDVFIWTVLEVHLGILFPRILKDILASIIFLVATISIVAIVFQQSVTHLWATSGVVGLVVGFALKGMIADLFAGIAINVDNTYKIGDWIEIHPRSVEPMRGCVREINWRSTRIRTTDNTEVVLPNSFINEMVIVNLSRPGIQTRFELQFCLEFGIPAERALRVLQAGVNDAEGILKDPKPKVLVDHIDELGVEYKVRYWLNPAECSPKRGRHAVTSSILNHLFHAGLSLAYPKQDVYYDRMPKRQLDSVDDRASILGRMEIFSVLDSDEISAVSKELKQRQFAKGVAVVEDGVAGQSMFVLVEGLLQGCRQTDEGRAEVDGYRIHPGEVFGEMSLLAGEAYPMTLIAQTDTVVYEIHKNSLNRLLIRRPEIAREISRVMANRKDLLESLTGNLKPTEEEQPAVADYILGKMTRFFDALSPKGQTEG